MTVQNYCMVNEQTNICENVILWDGDTETWTPPANYLMLVQADTPSKGWMWDEAGWTWVITDQQGQGQIGDMWDGVYLVTQAPMPEIPPKPPVPTVDGVQTL